MPDRAAVRLGPSNFGPSNFRRGIPSPLGGNVDPVEPNDGAMTALRDDICFPTTDTGTNRVSPPTAPDIWG